MYDLCKVQVRRIDFLERSKLTLQTNNKLPLSTLRNCYTSWYIINYNFKVLIVKVVQDIDGIYSQTQTTSKQQR